MTKKYISLVELLLILSITTITGSLATKLFFGFLKENAALEKHQQSHRDFKNLIRSCREWAAVSGPGINELDESIISESNEISIVDGEVIIWIGEKSLVHKIPKGFKVSFDIEEGSKGEGLLLVKAERKELAYSLKLALGGKYEKE